jgi:hypothetical protein
MVKLPRGFQSRKGRTYRAGKGSGRRLRAPTHKILLQTRVQHRCIHELFHSSERLNDSHSPVVDGCVEGSLVHDDGRSVVLTCRLDILFRKYGLRYVIDIEIGICRQETTVGRLAFLSPIVMSLSNVPAQSHWTAPTLPRSAPLNLLCY